jgi:hypothetical protein
MPSVNDDGRLHASFIESSVGEDFLFWPYSGGAPRATLTRAMAIIQKNIFGKINSCNSYFANLPGGSTFDALWSDPNLWLNWDPRPNPGFYGATAGSRRKEITISNFALNRGTWVTVATIVHEMAHVNGAPGAPSMAAENALTPCGLKGLVDRGAIGMRPRAESESGNRYA